MEAAINQIQNGQALTFTTLYRLFLTFGRYSNLKIY